MNDDLKSMMLSGDLILNTANLAYLSISNVTFEHQAQDYNDHVNIVPLAK